MKILIFASPLDRGLSKEHHPIEMNKLIFSFSFLLLAACVDVPTTTIKIPTANGVVIIKAPKDSKLVGLKANFEKGTVSLDSYEAKMNPDVIGASALGQVELIKANTELATSLGQMGMTSFARANGIPLGSGVAPSSQVVNQTITQDQLNAIIEKRAGELAAAKIATNQPATPMRGPRNRPASTNPLPSNISTNAP